MFYNFVNTKGITNNNFVLIEVFYFNRAICNELKVVGNVVEEKLGSRKYIKNM